MRFAVVGAGAIGAYVGAALIRGGSEVVMIARGPRLRDLERFGVSVHSPRGNFHVNATATDSFSAVTGVDCVLITVKAYSLPAVAESLAPYLRADMPVVFAQNGLPWWYFQRFDGPLAGSEIRAVDPSGTISRAINAHQAIGCVIYCSTELERRGIVRHIEGTRFAIGDLDGRKTRQCEDICSAFRRGGLKCTIDSNIRNQLWLKLVGNVAFNPVSVLTEATLGELGANESMRRVLRGIIEEAASVAHALGVKFPVSLERRLEAGLEVGDHRTSMLQDFESGKPLELDCMTAAIMEVAAKLNLDVTRIEVIHACTSAKVSRRAVRVKAGGAARALSTHPVGATRDLEP